MKIKLILLGLLIPTLLSAEPKTEWPKIDYSTELIGQFMAFCTASLNNMTMSGAQQGISSNPVGQVMANAKVCCCIMDSYRLKNSEFLFRTEFESKNESMIPYFLTYFNDCREINNNIQLLKNGT